MCENKVNKILDWLNLKLEAKQSCIILYFFLSKAENWKKNNITSVGLWFVRNPFIRTIGIICVLQMSGQQIR